MEVHVYLSQLELLKQKVIATEHKLASHKERIYLYDEQLQDLKKMLAKEEAQSWGCVKGVEELREKNNKATNKDKHSKKKK